MSDETKRDELVKKEKEEQINQKEVEPKRKGGCCCG